MKRNLGLVVSLFVASQIGLGCGSSAESSPAPAPAPPKPQAGDFFSVDSIDIYQATKVSVVADGAPTDSFNAPIIAGRPAFVRVRVAPTTDNVSIPVDGELHLSREGHDDVVVKASQGKLYKMAREASLATTLNFDVPADAMAEGTSLSVKLSASSVADGALAFPADASTIDLAVKADSQTLHVKLVPITYNSDGSGRAPDLSDTSFYRGALYQMYPVANVDIQVREPMAWASEVAPDGNGWDELLNGILQLRRADKASVDTYYVGVFNPSTSLRSFCSQGGCVLGIAPASDGNEVGLRGALVLGYKSPMAGGTLAQELAHTMGRLHAPCGNPAAIDRKFPYKDGGIGNFGYDIVNHELIDPNDYSDFMSYCSPVWVSDYTFSGIYNRISLVSGQAGQAGSSSKSGTSDTGSNGATGPSGSSPIAKMSEMMMLQISPDGTVKPGGLIDVIDDGASSTGAPTELAETLPVRLESEGGKLVSIATGKVRSLSNTKSKFVLVPRPAFGVATARVMGRSVDIRALAMTSARAN